MISRRALLQWSAAAMAAAPIAASAKALDLPAGADALLIDTRFARPPGVKTLAPRIYTFDGDLTRIWYETLDPIWRKPGFVLAGVTGHDALFVLERLAWDRGRRVVAQRELALHGLDGRPVSSWLIAPVHPSVRG